MPLSTSEFNHVAKAWTKPIEIPCSATPRVSIIIPSAAKSTFLLACLRSLSRYAPLDIPFEMIVILNNATDADAADITADLRGVTVLNTPVNLGLAGSGNVGYSIAKGELIILLHDDAEIEANWMEALVSSADRFNDAGAIGGKVLNPDGTLQNVGSILWNDANTAPPWIGAPPSAAAFDQHRIVDYCGTSSLLVRRTTWERLGGLDEQFFPVYYVDVDLAMGIRSLGQYVLYEPGSRIRHHRGASTDVRMRDFIIARNRERFRSKWSGALTMHQPPNTRLTDAINSASIRYEAARDNGQYIQAETPSQVFANEDMPALETRYLLSERSLLRDFADELIRSLDAQEQTTNHWQEIAFSLQHMLDIDNKQQHSQGLNASEKRRLKKKNDDYHIIFARQISGLNWYTPEHAANDNDYCWTGPGVSSSLDISFHTYTDVMVEFCLQWAIHEEVLKSLTLTVKDQLITLVSTIENGKHIYQGVIPRRMFDNGGSPTSLTFNVDHTLAATEFNPAASDTRKLGVAIAWLKVYPI